MLGSFYLVTWLQRARGHKHPSVPLPRLPQPPSVQLHPHGVWGATGPPLPLPPPSLAKPAAWCPQLPRDSASTLCWAEGSGGAPWSRVSASALPLSSFGFSEFGGHFGPFGSPWGVGGEGWGESSVGLARALEISVPYGLVDCPPIPQTRRLIREGGALAW